MFGVAEELCDLGLEGSRFRFGGKRLDMAGRGL